MKRFVAMIVLMLCILFVIPGMGKGSLTRVRLTEVTHSIFYAPQYAAINLGFFGAEGLDIELTNGQGTDKVMTTVLSGQADIGLGGPEATKSFELMQEIMKEAGQLKKFVPYEKIADTSFAVKAVKTIK